MKLFRLWALLSLVGVSSYSIAQVCHNSFVDSADQFQISSLKLGANALRVFDMPAHSTDCDKSRFQEDEYGCSYRTKDNTVFRIYAGKVVSILMPARLMTAKRNIAKLTRNDSLTVVIKKINVNLPDGFPVWRVFYDDRQKSIILSTGQCIVSGESIHWELNLQFNENGRLQQIEAYVPYP